MVAGFEDLIVKDEDGAKLYLSIETLGDTAETHHKEVWVEVRDEEKPDVVGNIVALPVNDLRRVIDWLTAAARVIEP